MPAYFVQNQDVTRSNLKQEVQKLAVVQNNFYTNRAITLQTTSVEITDAQRKFLGTCGHIFIDPSAAAVNGAAPSLRWGVDTSANAKTIIDSLKIPDPGNQRVFHFHQTTTSSPAEENVTMENTNQTATFVTFASGSQATTNGVSAHLLFEKATGTASLIATNNTSTESGATTHRVHFNVYSPGIRSRGFDVARNLGFTDPAVGTIVLDNTTAPLLHDLTITNFTHWGETGRLALNLIAVTSATNTVDVRFGDDTSVDAKARLKMLKVSTIGDQRMLFVDVVIADAVGGPDVAVSGTTATGGIAGNVTFGRHTQTPAATTITLVPLATRLTKLTFVVTNTSTVTLGVTDYKIHFNLLTSGE
jgi:hypothetical protein